MFTFHDPLKDKKEKDESADEGLGRADLPHWQDSWVTPVVSQVDWSIAKMACMPNDVTSMFIPHNKARLHLYHLSKCGGTTIMNLLNENLLTVSGKQRWIGQHENRGDPAYCRIKPQGIFILATIRNPFEFYVSYWKMIIQNAIRFSTFDPFEYGGIGPEAKKRHMYDVYLPENAYCATTFGKWLNLVLDTLGGMCNGEPKSISNIYNSMMLDIHGHEIFDALVRIEDFYPSFRRALEKFETFAPNSINWSRFEKAVASNETHGKIHIGTSDYSSYYTETSRRLVERHDRTLLEQYEYSFEQLVRNHEHR